MSIYLNDKIQRAEHPLFCLFHFDFKNIFIIKPFTFKNKISNSNLLLYNVFFWPFHFRILRFSLWQYSLGRMVLPLLCVKDIVHF